ncbi:MAG: hypothetical protein LLF94_03910, partial [Chlamydiales bacterium]|nr:hypothetical protein [Chlamydiales bacterium]
DGAVKKHFKPEFLNRLTDVVIFQPLSKDTLRHILDLEMKKIQKRLVNKDVTITLTDSAKEFLVEKGFQPEMGARPLRRTVEQYVEDQLAEQLLSHPDESWNADLVAEGEKIVFVQKEPSVAKPKPPKEKNRKAKVAPVAPVTEAEADKPE